MDHAVCYYPSTSDVWENEKSIYKSCNKYARLERISIADIADEISALIPWFPPKCGEFDHHNGVGLEEQLRGRGIGNFKSEQYSDVKNSECYNLVKRLYTEGQLDLYDYEPLTKEMLILEAEVSKNKVKVRAPNAKGCHDDLSDAFSTAVKLAYDDTMARPMASILSAGGGGVRSAGTMAQRMNNAAHMNGQRSSARQFNRVSARMRRTGR